MSFSGLNYLAVLIAAAVGWLVGAGWYTVLAKPWVAALGETAEQVKQGRAAQAGTAATVAPFILALVANLVMAWVLAGLLGHLGPSQVTIRNGIVSGAFVWAGFVITTLSVNYAFSGRKLSLTIIDGGHWLLVLMVQGAIIGAFG